MHAFLDDMPAAFAQADLVVSRAGMGAVSEIAAAGKPSILVPLPTASDQHQLRNAEAFEKAGAALLVPDREMTRRAPGGGGYCAGRRIRRAWKRWGERRKAFARPGAAAAGGRRFWSRSRGAGATDGH